MLRVSLDGFRFISLIFSSLSLSLSLSLSRTKEAPKNAQRVLISVTTLFLISISRRFAATRKCPIASNTRSTRRRHASCRFKVNGLIPVKGN